jgi:hypothetical protein
MRLRASAARCAARFRSAAVSSRRRSSGPEEVSGRQQPAGVDGTVVLTARALLIRQIESPVVGHDAPPDRPPPAFDQYSFTFFRSDVGYHTAIELRLVSGAFGSGRMACWMRQRAALIDGEAPSGAQRVLVLADAGSGVSAALDITRYTFLNADLSVHLQRPISGEWLLLDAATSSAGNGNALADKPALGRARLCRSEARTSSSTTSPGSSAAAPFYHRIANADRSGACHIRVEASRH